jgi:hypothetical protein
MDRNSNIRETKSTVPATIVTPAGCSTAAGAIKGWARGRGIFWKVLLFCWLVSGVRAADKFANSDCLDCHGDNTLTKTNAVGKAVSLFVDQAKLAASVHKTTACADCHTDVTKKHPDDNRPLLPVNCTRCHERETESYGASVHGIALKAGRADAANCGDCHDSHSALPATSPESPLYFAHQATTCGECHEEAVRDWAASATRRPAPIVIRNTELKR